MLRSNNIPNGNSNVHQACASCKHQRKKCPSDCVLAPYFPADKTRDFQAVHKVFGVANVGRFLRSVKEEERKYVAHSLIWEAYCRQKDPILGPYGEYKKIFDELKLYKTQNQNQFLSSGNFKQVGSLINGWNNNNNMNNKSIGKCNNFNIENENSSNEFGYTQYYVQCQKQERDLRSIIVQSQEQQQPQYNKQVYLPTAGQYNSNSGKTIESTIWDDEVHFD
ncbi:hypothetical protein ACFE04_030708 [Oxalis oulophora]